MKESQYNWKINEVTAELDEIVSELESLSINPELAPLLYRRGVTKKDEVKPFFQPTMNNLYDPYLFYDMEKVIVRIQEAVEKGEKILIYGDYDADGITSTTVMKEAIELIGGHVVYYLPNRFEDGYGPNRNVYQRMIEEEGIQLIITVDNGVSGHEAIDYANSQQVDVIITDHHELPDALPNAYGIIHPRHPKGSYPFSDLAGVGVAFKVATALLGEVPIESLDLVAIGTIADLVSLTDENRVLVKIGLEMIKQSERIGLEALADVAKIDLTTANEETIGFNIGPRLNAIGRLAEASPGVELLSTFDEIEAGNIATYIEQKNTERQTIVKEITAEALEMAKENTQDSILFLMSENWHQGVLGIVASRIVQETNKPTVVLYLDKETGLLKGSGRSVQGLDLFQTLSVVKDELTSFGGHHMAAGLTFDYDKLEGIKERVEDYIRTSDIDLHVKEELIIDEVLPIEAISVSFVETLQQLSPFGTDNPSPYFLIKSDKVNQLKQIGADKSHLKCQMTKNGINLDCIAFNRGNDYFEFEYADKIEVVGQLSINEWNGFRKPQFMLKDYQISDWQIFDARGNKSKEVGPHTQSIAYLIFNKESASFVKNQERVYLIEKIDLKQLDQINHFEEVVIVDCPYNLEIAQNFFKLLRVPRIYFEVNVNQEHYLTGLPTREQFGRLFKLIASQESIDIRYKLKEISTYLKIEKNLLIFMIRVFFDLRFVTIDDGLMTKVQNPTNKSLQESHVYQSYQRKIEMEKLFLYSDIKEIKHWILQQEEPK